MEPRVSKRDKKLHLTYELPHRIHSAHIYPVAAPNGSTVVIYSHDRGLRILWRGGRRRRTAEQARSHPDCTGSQYDIMGREQARSQSAHQDEYEDEETEVDPDSPFAPIIQDVNVDLGTEVLLLAVPALPALSSSGTTGTILSTHVVVVAACADGTQRVLSFQLAPPAQEDVAAYADDVAHTQDSITSTGPVRRAIAAKVVTSDTPPEFEESSASSFLLVAAVSDKLHTYRYLISDELTRLDEEAPTRPVPLPHLAKAVAFHPSMRSTQLLITDVSGGVRIYDPYAAASSSEDSTLDRATASGQSGKWIMTFYTSFSGGPAGLAKRKRILDSKWIMNGKAILTLLVNGEWGIWDISASSEPNKSPASFFLSGVLGSSTAPESTEPTRQRKGTSRLAPMTPNTRKAKAEVLFSGPAKIPGVAAKGGISVSTTTSRTGQMDDSMLLWYNNDIYSIPSLQAFWQRSTSSNNSNNAFGSLYSPGLTHVTGVNLVNEDITSISQLPAHATSTNLGLMNTPRDLIVSTEHRLMILQSLKPLAPPRALFQQAAVEARDQRMLDAGELDIGGVDRMLDGMVSADARPRRVGFVH